ncbi:hypothetical protein [Roseobacter sp.]|uniref:hypothetical protein n=1 Tax=Roseobacter sp. TaxID=1907202 RepID=UPI0025E6E884|nr:hypothetical protein [Roseobacter sp.]
MRQIVLISLPALAACAPQVPVADDFIPDYLGVQATALGEDLVQFNVSMTKAQSRLDVQRYAECAAAHYTVVRGYGFTRHLRTNVTEEGGVWAADAVYTISPTLPDGLAVIDAQVTTQACMEAGIPTV